MRGGAKLPKMNTTNVVMIVLLIAIVLIFFSKAWVGGGLGAGIGQNSFFGVAKAGIKRENV
jgi:preprotein translocase subunit SecG